MPAFGIALSYTLVTTYLPVTIHQLSGPTVAGVLIGGEGVFALFLPIVIGSWSDSLRTRLGGRMPFVLAGTTLATVSLVFMPVFSGSLTGVAIALAGFSTGYFVYYSPYYVLFPNLISNEERGRSQGFQGAFRSAGMLLALAGGGFLLSLWLPLPFLVGAVAIASITTALFFMMRDRLKPEKSDRESGNSAFTANWKLRRQDRDIRNWTIANSMWEATIAPASLSGKLADRYSHRPVMPVALWGFGLGLLPEKEHHGAGASLFGSTGFLVFGETKGFSSMFGVASAFLLGSIPVPRRIQIERDGLQ